MRESFFSTVTAAHKALAMVIVASDLDRMPVTHFEPTDLGSLPDLTKGGLVAARQETAQANRIRAASHMFLVAASDALVAALALSKVSMELDGSERERLLTAIGARSSAAGQNATEAARILCGEMEPPADESMVVSKLDS